MVTKDSNLRINVDVSKAEAKAKSLTRELQQLGAVGVTAGSGIHSGMTVAGESIGRAGDQAAATAVRFQTMTTGMLNLSTSAAQTYTSVSSLDRAFVHAHSASVALERANDTLARKTFILNKEMQSAHPNMEKIKLLQNEIATSTDRASVAFERNQVAQQDVLDTQILFATNIANVVVSSLQTAALMMSEHTRALVMNTAMTKLNALAQFNTRNALFGTTIQRAIDSKIIYTNTGALVASTVATKLQIVALTGLKVALGPIGLIFIGISAAMAAYETNAFGLKDTINGLLGIHDDFKDSINRTADSQNDMTDALSKTNDVAQRLPDSFAKLNKAMQEYHTKLERAAEAQKVVTWRANEINTAISQHINITGNFSTAGSNMTRNFSTAGSNTTRNFSTAGSSLPDSDRITSMIRGGSSVSALEGLTAMAKIWGLWTPQSQNMNNVDRNPLIDNDFQNKKWLLLVQLGFKGSNFPDGRIPQEIVDWADHFTSAEQVFSSVENMKEYGRLLNVQLSAQELTPKNIMAFKGLGQLVKDQKRGQDALLFTTEEMKNLSFLKDKKMIQSFLAGVQKSGETDIISFIDKKILHKIIVNGDVFTNRANIMLSRGRAYSGSKTELGLLNGTLKKLSGYKIGENMSSEEFIREIAFAKENVGKSIYLTSSQNSFLKKLESGQIGVNRAAVYKEYGIDIGAVADALSYQDARAIASVEMGLSRYSHILNTGKIESDKKINQYSIQFYKAFKTFDKNLEHTGLYSSFPRLSGLNVSAPINTTLDNYNRNKIIELLGLAGTVSGVNTGRGGFQGLSASKSFQAIKVSTPQHILDATKASDSYFSGGQLPIFGLFELLTGSKFGVGRTLLSSSGAKDYVKNYSSLVSSVRPLFQTASEFGIQGDPDSQEAIAQIAQSYLSSNKSAGQFQLAIDGMREVTAKFADKTEATLSSIGIDVDLGHTRKRYFSYYGGQYHTTYIEPDNADLKSPLQRILSDIGASQNISIPYGSSLVSRVNEFANNGMFTNFNNVAITKMAMNGLTLQEQAVFDIRFEATRGDRELLNRLRFVEELQAMSSGTSPI